MRCGAALSVLGLVVVCLTLSCRVEGVPDQSSWEGQQLQEETGSNSSSHAWICHMNDYTRQSE